MGAPQCTPAGAGDVDICDPSTRFPNQRIPYAVPYATTDTLCHYEVTTFPLITPSLDRYAKRYSGETDKGMRTTVEQIMNRQVEVCYPQDSLNRAAQIM